MVKLVVVYIFNDGIKLFCWNCSHHDRLISLVSLKHSTCLSLITKWSMLCSWNCSLITNISLKHFTCFNRQVKHIAQLESQTWWLSYHNINLVSLKHSTCLNHQVTRIVQLESQTWWLSYHTISLVSLKHSTCLSLIAKWSMLLSQNYSHHKHHWAKNVT